MLFLPCQTYIVLAMVKEDRGGQGVRKEKVAFFPPLMSHCSSLTNIWHGLLRPWLPWLNTSASAQLRHRSTVDHVFVLEHRSGEASSAEREVPLLCFFPSKLDSALVLQVGQPRLRTAGLLSQNQAIPRFSFGARRAAMASWRNLKRNCAPLSGHVCWQG